MLAGVLAFGFLTLLVVTVSRSGSKGRGKAPPVVASKDLTLDAAREAFQETLRASQAAAQAAEQAMSVIRKQAKVVNETMKSLQRLSIIGNNSQATVKTRGKGAQLPASETTRGKRAVTSKKRDEGQLKTAATTLAPTVKPSKQRTKAEQPATEKRQAGKETSTKSGDNRNPNGTSSSDVKKPQSTVKTVTSASRKREDKEKPPTKKAGNKTLASEDCSKEINSAIEAQRLKTRLATTSGSANSKKSPRNEKLAPPVASRGSTVAPSSQSPVKDRTRKGN